MQRGADASPELFLDWRERPETTLRRRVQGALRDAIRDGRLVGGARLPSSRALAGDLGVSRGVIVDAFEQLVAEGYLTGQRGSGTTVALGVSNRDTTTPERAEMPAWRISFDPGNPDLDGFPRSMWTAAVRAALRDLPSSDLGYGDPFGLGSLRRGLADYLGRVRGASVRPSNITIVGSVTQGLTMLGRALARLGHDAIGVEDPGAYVQRAGIVAAGLETVPIAVDHRGLRPTELEASGVDAVLLTPAHQYPTGCVLDAGRRGEILAWARADAHRLIVEDDYDAEFRYDRQPIGCLQGVLPGQTILTGSVSKALAPALRLGWLVLPDRLVAPVRDVQEREAVQPSVVTQAAFEHLLAGGSYDRHIRAMRPRYRSRRDAVVSVLGTVPGTEIVGIEAGLHAIVMLPVDADEHAIAEAAAASGVFARPLATYRLSAGPPGLVLGYAHLTEQRITEGARVIADAIVSRA